MRLEEASLGPLAVAGLVAVAVLVVAVVLLAAALLRLASRRPAAVTGARHRPDHEDADAGSPQRDAHGSSSAGPAPGAGTTEAETEAGTGRPADVLPSTEVVAPFVDVARRDQRLLDRQLEVLDSLEHSEDDPEVLVRLFQLDNLATRMRRNADSLLVLAAAETGRRARSPMPLTDVVRTASSQIEHYDRVVLDLADDPVLLGHHVVPVAHLVAELLENATTFSDPTSVVEVTGGEATEAGSISITILDAGLGMSDADLAEANRKVDGRQSAAETGFQRLGLYVVGRLAQRVGACVRFAARGEGQGTEVTVTLPGAVFADRPAPLGPGGDLPGAPPAAAPPPSAAPPAQPGLAAALAAGVASIPGTLLEPLGPAPVLDAPVELRPAGSATGAPLPRRPVASPTGSAPSGAAPAPPATPGTTPAHPEPDAPPSSALPVRPRTGAVPRVAPSTVDARTGQALAAAAGDPGTATSQPSPWTRPDSPPTSRREELGGDEAGLSGSAEQALGGPVEQAVLSDRKHLSERLAWLRAVETALDRSGAGPEGYRPAAELAHEPSGLARRTPRETVPRDGRPAPPPGPALDDLGFVEHGAELVRARLTAFRDAASRGRHHAGDDPVGRTGPQTAGRP